MTELHHPVAPTRSAPTLSLSQVDDVRLRGGVATATRNYARYRPRTRSPRAGATTEIRIEKSAEARDKEGRKRKERRAGGKGARGGGRRE